MQDLEFEAKMNEIAAILEFLGAKIPSTFELPGFGCGNIGCSKSSIPVIEHAEFGHYIY
jgi:hypothetical protein